VFERFICALF